MCHHIHADRTRPVNFQCPENNYLTLISVSYGSNTDCFQHTSTCYSASNENYVIQSCHGKQQCLISYQHLPSIAQLYTRQQQIADGLICENHINQINQLPLYISLKCEISPSSQRFVVHRFTFSNSDTLLPHSTLFPPLSPLSPLFSLLRNTIFPVRSLSTAAVPSSPPLLTIAIFSPFTSIEFRNVIRHTWTSFMRLYLEPSLPQLYVGNGVNYQFFVPLYNSTRGALSSLYHQQLYALNHENTINHDVTVVGYEEETEKQVLLRYAAFRYFASIAPPTSSLHSFSSFTASSSLRFLAITDDTSFVNTGALLKLLHNFAAEVAQTETHTRYVILPLPEPYIRTQRFPTDLNACEFIADKVSSCWYCFV